MLRSFFASRTFGLFVLLAAFGIVKNAAAQTPCFSDNFNDGAAQGWSPLTSSRWQVSSDAGSLRYFLNTTNYQSPDDIRLGELSVLTGQAWGDFSLECLAKSADAAAGAGGADLCLVFGYQDFDSYYYVNFNSNPGLTQLYRIHNSADVLLATYNAATFADGNYHRLRVTRNGSEIRAYFDGAQVLAANDNFFAQGLVGVGSFNDSGYFDDITLAGDACLPGELFTDISAPLSGVSGSSVAWGDYDNDGDLDILLAGSASGSNPISKVYRNDSGNFTDVAAALAGVSNGISARWGDYDNDGDLDILLTGSSSSGAVSKVYRNEGEGFLDIFASLIGIYNSAAEWGDYDNDGDLDVLLTGYLGSLTASKLYRNNRGGFEEISTSLPNIRHSAVAWGDYDSDNDLDLLLTGDASNPIAKVYRNEAENFVDLGVVLTGVTRSSAAWGDYDNDGDLDILLAGQIATPFTSNVTKIYRNEGGNFVDINTTLLGVRSGSVAWGDYDNDGDLDVLLTGNAGTFDFPNPVSKIYRNDSGNFAELSTSLLNVESSAAVWGDYDNDGDLDILLTGYNSGATVAKVYRNNTTTMNTAPVAPTGLAAAVNGNRATLDWNKSTDAQTPSNGLTYNLRLGVTPGGVEILSPMADHGSGYRRLPQLGNTNHGNNWQVKNLPNGTYYWSVQAVDHEFAGSVFAAEQTFNVSGNRLSAPQNLQAATSPGAVILTWATNLEPNLLRYRIYRSTHPPASTLFDSVAAGVTTYVDSNIDPATYFYRLTAVDQAFQESDFSNEAVVSPNLFVDLSTTLSGITAGSVAWGDYDNDEDLDILLAGSGPGFNRISKVYRNDSGNFTDVAAALAAVSNGSARWGDYDNDGDLDILLTGNSNSTPISKVYRNDGGSFVDIFASVMGANNGAAWGDYDNDGDLDILIMVTHSPKLYRNEGEDVFVLVPINLIAVGEGALDWGDYDNDGDLDIAITGSVPINSRIAKLYRNESNGNFVEVNANLAGAAGGAVSWGDYDNDGDLDILLTGVSTGLLDIAIIYRNDGNEIFTDLNANLQGLIGGAAWGDYDNDGDLDILLTGSSGSNAFSRVYRNDGNGAFTDIAAGLQGVSNSAVAWGDYDNDRDLDILLTGAGITKIYRNESVTSNTLPLAPTNLSSMAAGDRVTLSWSSTTDNETPAFGLSYNLRIGKTPNGNEVASAQADQATGYRRIVDLGNSQKRTSWNIKRLVPGAYYWSVQALDHAFAGSAFANEQYFIVDYPADEIPPAKPQNLQASGDDQRVTVTWAANSENDLLRYRVYRGTASAALARIASVSARTTIYVDNDVVNDTTYFYRLTAVDQTLNESEFSDQVSAMPTALSFTEIPVSLTSGNFAVWGDLDNDNDLDLVLGAKIYLNTAGTFTEISAALPGGAAAVGDYDNDGDLDLVQSARIFRNGLSGAVPAFVDIGAGLAASTAGCAWGDYDNDGDLDLIIGPKIYRQDRANGSVAFIDINTGLPQGITAVAWGDYDNDGDLDLLLTGADLFAFPITKVYRNEGNDQFVDIGLFPNRGAAMRVVAWGDYDNDGDLDFLVVGDVNDHVATSRIYRNDNGAFVSAHFLISAFRAFNGTAAWGDCDSDGDLDVLITGDSEDFGVVPFTKIFRNDPAATDRVFIDISVSLPQVISAVAWADYDNDGDLDFILGNLGKIYRNDLNRANTSPAVPTKLSVNAANGEATFSWDKSSDSETPQSGLTYNLRLGVTPNGVERSSPMANVATGYRRIFSFGNTNHNNHWTIKGLPDGTYYWSVQAVDNNFAGSAFALEKSFTIPACASNGDINNDGILTPGDALCAFTIYLNGGAVPADCDAPNTECETLAADVNCDGATTPGDALAIFQRYLQNLPPAECFGKSILSKTANARGPYQLKFASRPGKSDNTNEPEYVRLVATLENPAGLQAFGLTLSYPAQKLEYLGVRRLGLLSDWLQFDAAAHEQGEITLGAFHQDPIAGAQPGRLFEILFSVKEELHDLYGIAVDASVDDFMQAQFEIEDLNSKPAAAVPTVFRLEHSFPNPFYSSRPGSEALIRFDLPGIEAMPVELTIFNIAGQMVRRLISENRMPGSYAAVWEGTDQHGALLPSGTYLYRLRAGNFVASKSMIVVR